jgi:hypothetical protein
MVKLLLCLQPLMPNMSKTKFHQIWEVKRAD